MEAGKHSVKLLFPMRDRAAERQGSWGGEGHRCIPMFTVSALWKAIDFFDLKKLQTDGGDIMCSAEGSASNTLQWEVMFLGPVARAFALPDIHWCMKFLCHSGGTKPGEEQEVPLSWLCPLMAGRVSGRSWRSLWILSGSALKMSEERLG